MAQRPVLIAFDVIETLFPLEPLRARITRAGQPGHVLEVWFARLLRDAFALTAAGGYRPFPDVAAGALAAVGGRPPRGARGSGRTREWRVDDQNPGDAATTAHRPSGKGLHDD